MIDIITEALAKKFSRWVGQKVVVCQDVKALAVLVASGNNDKVKLPIYALVQARTPRVNEAGKTQMSAEGLATGGDDTQNKFLRLVPVTLSYSFLIISETKSDCLDRWQQVVTKAINNPGVEVEIPYADLLNDMGQNVKRTHWFGFNVVDEVEEVGTTPADELLEGNFHGQEIGLQFNDAYIMFNRTDKPVGIESIQVEMRGDKTVEVELVYAEEDDEN